MRVPSVHVIAACAGVFATVSSGCAAFGDRGAGGPETYTAPDERFVFFTAGSAKIASEGGFFSIGYVVALLDQDPHYYVLIVGQADPSGDEGTNRKLSFDRARAVRDVLIENGVDKKRVLIAAPKELTSTSDPSLSRRADIYVYDPVQEEASHRLGYEVEIRVE